MEQLNRKNVCQKMRENLKKKIKKHLDTQGKIAKWILKRVFAYVSVLQP